MFTATTNISFKDLNQKSVVGGGRVVFQFVNRKKRFSLFCCLRATKIINLEMYFKIRINRSKIKKNKCVISILFDSSFLFEDLIKMVS